MNRRQLLKSVPAVAIAMQSRAATPTTQARLRTAICAYSYRDLLKAKTMTYDDVIRLAVEMGVDGVEATTYWFPNQDDSFLLPLKRTAYRSGVDLYGIGINTNLCQPDAQKRISEIEKIKSWVDTAEKLGARYVRVFGGPVPKEHTEQEAVGWVVEALKRAADYSGKKGIILGLETHGGITEKADTTVQIIRQVDSPWAGINLDVGNFNRDGYAQTERCVPYAVNAHIKASIADAAGNHQPTDWGRLLKLFADGGYKGYLSLEYEEKNDPLVAVPKVIRELRRGVKKYEVGV
jgi:sugar phosphate isomerase/epimerase